MWKQSRNRGNLPFNSSQGSMGSGAGGRSKEDFNKVHFKLQFEDEVGQFYCCVYYADDFAKLRAKFLGSGSNSLEEDFIESLSECVDFDGEGGKSGSTFYNTKDRRFLLKELSKFEQGSFPEFANGYFHHLNDFDLDDPKPLLLAKICGVFRIACKSHSTKIVSDILIIENLFRGYGPRQVRYDLKGSNRNRLVDGNKSVLLDENLMNCRVEAPLFVTADSKAKLIQTIDRETNFLTQQYLMDYSLLVAKIKEEKVLSMGIIDYVRRFTWDKKIETMVKSSGLLGGGFKQPTVIAPDLYQHRFRAAMCRYFVAVPDHLNEYDEYLDKMEAEAAYIDDGTVFGQQQ